jgi:hypothetical protein
MMRSIVSVPTLMLFLIANGAAPGDPGMTVTARSAEIYPKAQCDGKTDDTAALQAWLDKIADDRVLRLPAGTCVFKSTLTTPPGTFGNVTIAGSGYYTTTLEYAGSNTTRDLLTIGSGTIGDSRYEYGWTLTGFRITSATQMSGGAGIHLWHLIRSVVDLVIDGQDGSGRLWNGAWFDECDVVSLPYVAMRAQHDILLVNGSRASEPWWPNYVGEIRLGRGKIGSEALTASTASGIHLAGGVGGLSCEAVDVIGNKNNLVIDASISGTGNQSAVFGSGCYFDTSENGGDNILIDDGIGPGDVTWMGGNKALEIDGSIATCAATCLHIRRWRNGDIHIGSYQIADARNDGITYRDATASLLIGARTSINHNSGYGIRATVSSPAIALTETIFASNTSGAFSPSVLGSSLPIYLSNGACVVHLEIGGAVTGMAYSVQDCRYALKGDVVEVYFDLQLSHKGGNTGPLTLAGLPVTSGRTGRYGGGVPTYFENWSGLSGPLVVILAPNTATARVYQFTPTGLRQTSYTNLTNSTALSGYLRYRR